MTSRIACVFLSTALCFARTHEVSRGRSFRESIGPNLVFVLTPVENGWHIEILPTARCTDNDNWAMPFNPPFRNYNALNVAAEYSITAQQAVAGMKPRRFKFALTCEAYKTELARLQIVLWPYTYSQQEADRALADLGSSPLGNGTFTILNARIGPGSKIESINFKLSVSFPKN